MSDKRHSVLSPSSSSRWLNCPASVVLSKDMPDEASPYAQEGTLAHTVAEQAAYCVRTGRYPDTNLSVSLGGDAEMQAAADEYAHVLMSIKHSGDAVRAFEIECPLSLDNVTGEADSMGTADCVIVVDDVLHVVDFKYGRGVKVEAERNTQLGIYALAALELFKTGVNKVALHIVQPRIKHYARWDLTTEELGYFGEAVAERAHLALSLYEGKTAVLDEHFEANTDTCRFCKAKGSCPAFTATARNAVVESFPDLTERESRDLSAVLVVPDNPELLAKAFGAADMIELWVKTVRESMHRRLEMGEAIPGFKLVAGRPGNRKWRDEKEAEALLKRMRVHSGSMYEKKLVSPTKAERLAKAGELGRFQFKKLEALIERPDGKPVVAPDSDPRAALKLDVVDVFENLEG